jgi:hypothetical protein
MNKKLILSIIAFLTVLLAHAQEPRTKVLLLGCFHFDNPGLDVAKFENANILSEKRQKEVMEVVEILKKFKPGKIFVEVSPSQQARLDSNLLNYKIGQFTLRASETYQIGYRLAKELNLSTLYAVDYRDAKFPFDSLIKSATEAGQFGLLGNIRKSIDSIQNAFNETLAKSTVREILLKENRDENSALQVGAYFDFLVAGKEGNHVGSYLTSEWWRRNMIIYENILKRLDGKEEKILILFGSGHTALLKEMMKYNRNFELIPLKSVF